MKAWRLDAAKVNARRKAGSREPVARVQKLEGKAKIMGSTWLLDGLLLRGGYVTAADALPQEAFVPVTDAYAKRAAKLWRKLKRWTGMGN